MKGNDTLRRLQEEQRIWVAHNFGSDRPSWHPLLGAVEELGELAHAHLKEEQGIRSSEGLEDAAKDAVADCIIYLSDYCSARGFDLDEIVSDTWDEVKQRDWKKNPDDAHQKAEFSPGLVVCGHISGSGSVCVREVNHNGMHGTNRQLGGSGVTW